MRDFAKAKALVGTKWESDWFVIDGEHRELFEHGSYLTEMYGGAAESGYPEDLIEGFHLLSTIDAVNHGKLDFGEGLVGWNYGLDKVRFVRPAMINRRYRCRNELVDAVEKSSGLLFRRSVEIVDEGDEVMMVAEWLTMLIPRQD